MNLSTGERMKLRYSAFYSSYEGRFVGVRSFTYLVVIRMNFDIPRGSYVRKEGVKYNPSKQLLDDGVLDKVEKFEDFQTSNWL